MLASKDDGFLDVIRRSSVDADYWHAPLSTRNPEGGVEVASLDRPIGKGVCPPVDDFCCTRLIGTPDAVVPAIDDVSAVSCGGVVAGGGWRDWMDQRLRDFRSERLELGTGWPTLRSRCTPAVLGRFWEHRCQAKGDGQQRREEKHDRPVWLRWNVSVRVWRFILVLWMFVLGIQLSVGNCAGPWSDTEYELWPTLPVLQCDEAKKFFSRRDQCYSEFRNTWHT